MPRSEYTWGTTAYNRQVDYNNYQREHTFSQIRDDSARHRREMSHNRSNNTDRSSRGTRTRAHSPDMGGINSNNPATSICAKVCYVVLFGLFIILLIAL